MNPAKTIELETELQTLLATGAETIELAWFQVNALLKASQEARRIAPIEQAAIKIVKCKGRYHTEQNMIALGDLLGIVPPPAPRIEISEGALCFADKDVAQNLEAQAKHLDCPTCKGSGHIDDAEKSNAPHINAGGIVKDSARWRWFVRHIDGLTEAEINALLWDLHVNYESTCQKIDAAITETL